MKKIILILSLCCTGIFSTNAQTAVVACGPVRPVVVIRPPVVIAPVRRVVVVRPSVVTVVRPVTRRRVVVYR